MQHMVCLFMYVLMYDNIANTCVLYLFICTNVCTCSSSVPRITVSVTECVWVQIRVQYIQYESRRPAGIKRNTENVTATDLGYRYHTTLERRYGSFALFTLPKPTLLNFQVVTQRKTCDSLWFQSQLNIV